jgi:catechol-2,3-dioxygenase
MLGTPLPNDDWHFGFSLSSRSELESWRNNLIEKGLEAGEIKGNNFYGSFYLRDPEGNDIEFFWEEPPAP